MNISGTKKFLLMILFVIFLFAISTSSNANDYKNILGLGFETGYSELNINQPATPYVLKGAKERFRLFYGISDVFGVEFIAGAAIYANYVPLYTKQIENDDGEMVTTVFRDNKVSAIMSQDLGISFLYTFDIMRIIPYVSLGVFSTRFSRKILNISYVDYALAFKADFGVDFVVTKHFWLGVLANFNTYLTEYCHYNAQTNFFLRTTWVWNLKNHRK